MPVSKYQIEKREQLKGKVVGYYEEGLSTREIAKLVGKSHNWVWLVIKDRLGYQSAEKKAEKKKVDKNNK